MKKLLLLVFAFIMTLNLTGCLNVETKEYSFKLKSGTSGEGKIKYINIMRSEDSATTVEDDYRDLIDNYLKGKKPEDEMLGVKNVKKRLFEEDNHLCGEITFEFSDITSLKFYKYNNKVWCYSLASAGGGLFGGDAYFSSNGTYGGENMQVIFWDASETEFKFKTVSSQEGKKNISLLDIWKQKGE